MNTERPFNTLFLMISVDGKITTGGTDDRDTDKDYPKIPGIKEGLHQYYDLEKTTDMYSLNTGRTMMKIGVATDHNPIHCPKVTFIIIDNDHLNLQGVNNLCDNLGTMVLVTHKQNHPAFSSDRKNLKIVYYEKQIDFKDLFRKFKQDFGIDRITIQSGGTMNSILLRNGLIDKLSVVVVPCLIGGKATSSLVDGKDLLSEADLKEIKTLKLEKAEVLEDSYLHLAYSVNN